MLYFIVMYNISTSNIQSPFLTIIWYCNKCSIYYLFLAYIIYLFFSFGAWDILWDKKEQITSLKSFFPIFLQKTSPADWHVENLKSFNSSNNIFYFKYTFHLFYWQHQNVKKIHYNKLFTVSTYLLLLIKKYIVCVIVSSNCFTAR